MRRSWLETGVLAITGASSGIGKATALMLAKQGCRLALSGRNLDALEETARQARDAGAEVFVCPADVRRRQEVEAFVQGTIKRFGRLDALICSAGVYLRGPVTSRTVPEYEESMAVNFYGTLYAIYAALPQMQAQRFGRIVVVSSVDGKKGLPLDAPYVSSKFAVTGFLDVLRQELHGTGVTVTNVLPGRVDTPMIGHLTVPFASAKIPARKVAHAVERALRRHPPEIIVPRIGPRILLLASAISMRLADFLTRILHLEGYETDHERMRHNQ